MTDEELYGSKGKPLARVASQWSTPSVADTTGTRAARGGDRSGELLMRGQAEALSQWLTPRVSTGDYTRDGGKVGAERLTYEGQAKSLSSLLDPATSTHGDPSSPERRNLNPLFVEWLMGWPLGWTAFEHSETAWSLWLRRMQSALSALGSPVDAPLPQLSLFGG